MPLCTEESPTSVCGLSVGPVVRLGLKVIVGLARIVEIRPSGWQAPWKVILLLELESAGPLYGLRRANVAESDSAVSP